MTDRDDTPGWLVLVNLVLDIAVFCAAAYFIYQVGTLNGIVQMAQLRTETVAAKAVAETKVDAPAPRMEVRVK